MEAHKHNAILAELDPQDLEAIQSNLTLHHYERGQILFDTNVTVSQVYFPHDAVLSLLIAMQDGRSAETATLGREGLAGVEMVLNAAPDADDISTQRCIVQIGGNCSVAPLKPMRDLVRRSGRAHILFSSYGRALFTLASQTAACNALHSIEERCARWLLMTQDRAETDLFALTQEFLAEMLGVRRSSVNLAMGAFDRAGYLRHERGLISVLDRKGLESATCECYQTVNSVFQRVLISPAAKKTYWKTPYQILTGGKRSL